MPRFNFVWFASCVCLWLVMPRSVSGQNTSLLGQPQPREAMVQVNLQRPCQLAELFELAEQNLDVQYDFTPDVGKTMVDFRAPALMPKRAFELLISSIAQRANLMIIDGDIPCRKRVESSANMAKFAPFGTAEEVLAKDGPGAPVTQLFLLKKFNPNQLNPLIRPFQSEQGGKLVPIMEGNILIVTDYASNVRKIAEFIDVLERVVEVTVEFYSVKNSKSADLTEKANKILGGQESSSPPPVDGAAETTTTMTASAKSDSAIRFFDDANANRVIVVGRSDLVQQAMKTLERLDVSLDIIEKYYQPKNLTAQQLQAIVEGLLPPQDENRVYKGAVVEGANIFVVRASSDIIKKIDAILDSLDQSPIASKDEFEYIKLKNARAEDVLVTLLAFQDAYGTGFGGLGGMGGGQFFGGAFGVGIPGFPGQGMSPYGGAGLNPYAAGLGMGFGNQPLAVQQLPLQNGQPTTPGGMNGGVTGMGGINDQGSDRGGRGSQRDQGRQSALGGFGAGGSATLPGGVRVTADAGTNALILIGPASMLPRWKGVIAMLDQRRVQVAIEARLVTLNIRDAFTFGVEISGGGRNGPKRWFKATSFGLSELDAVTGALEIIPGTGSNFTIVNPDVADAVIRSLVTHRRARVQSTPHVVVNDNEEATLESLVSIPFQSVNASNTVSTTSVGGTQEAGTTILVTPHINEDDNLQLEYEIEFSNFTGTGTATLPPNRQIERVESRVTVPDGQTVIVGGLTREGESKDYAGLPWLDKIPLVRDFLGRTDESRDSTSFYVFLRPKILRDSDFNDLKFISDRQAGLMGIPSEYPSSLPILLPAAYIQP